MPDRRNWDGSDDFGFGCGWYTTCLDRIVVGWGSVNNCVSQSYKTVYPNTGIVFCKLLIFSMLHDPIHFGLSKEYVQAELPEWKIRTRRRMRRNCRERRTRLEERAEQPAGEYMQQDCLLRTFHLQEYSAISEFLPDSQAIIQISLILRQPQKLRSRRVPSVFQNNPRAFFPGMLYFR